MLRSLRQHQKTSLLATCSSSCYCSNSYCKSGSSNNNRSNIFQQQQHHQQTTNILSTSTHIVQQRTQISVTSMSSYGSMVPFQGYVSRDISAQPVPGGGQYKRGVLAQADLPYDREIMRVPAYLLFVGDAKNPRVAIPVMIRTILKRFVEDKRHASYISKRLLNMMVGGNPIFRSEDDVQEIILDVEGASEVFSRGLLTTIDMHRLACSLWFNRTECEYRGQPGVAIFPEVSFFNHSCEPNVALSYSWDVETGDYVVSARTTKPVHEGDQLVIQYFPDDVDLPLSRFQRKMQDRWAFTCLCSTCRTRVVLATLAAAFFLMLTLFVPLAVYSTWQRKHKLVEAGIA